AARAFDRMLLDAQEAPRGQRPGGDGEARQLRIVADLREGAMWRRATDAIGELCTRIEAFGAEIDPVLERLPARAEPSLEATQFLAKQLEAIAARLSAVALDLVTFAGEGDDLCRWMSVESSPAEAPRLALAVAPVEAGPQLRDSLFGSFESVVLT